MGRVFWNFSRLYRISHMVHDNCKTIIKTKAIIVICALAGCNSEAEQPSATPLLAGNPPSVSDEVQDSSAGSVDGGKPALQTDTSISQIVERSTLNADAAADAANDWPNARFATAGRIEAMPQRAGDPVEGRRALIEENYVNCGMPERVFRQLIADQQVVSIEGRTRLADGLPYSVNVFDNREGVSVAANNCLTCHATPLFGELVVGLGNELLDFTRNASVPVEQAGALVNGVAETRAWEFYANRIAAIAPYIQTETVGVNPANNLTFALVAHRDAVTGSWSDEPLLPLPPTHVPPVSVPPWWRMKKKPAMFNLGEGRSDHARIMMAASMLCSDSLEELDAIDQYAPDIRAYISSLDSPDYPFAIDTKVAAAGEELFTQNCSVCHGTYGNDSAHSYPAALVPLEVVQTDGMLVEFMHGDGVPYLDWFNRSFLGELSLAAPGPGYVAPPLDGIWATAPFLHNGSVPSINLVLDSPGRPDYWQHTVSDTSDPGSYDQTNLGWAYEELSADAAANAGKALYNTQLPGYSNTGHRFGDHLAAEERAAVIEYLKTL